MLDFFCILILFLNINVSTNLRFSLRMKSNTYVDSKVQNQNSIRPLGSYEKLMARKIPGIFFFLLQISFSINVKSQYFTMKKGQIKLH